MEVGPRDGLQNEKVLFDIHQKLDFINRLADAGARRMEVVSFVNPKRVPQMAGAEEIMAALPEGRFSRIGLVLNQRGWKAGTHRALDDIRESVTELRLYRELVFCDAATTAARLTALRAADAVADVSIGE